MVEGIDETARRTMLKDEFNTYRIFQSNQQQDVSMPTCSCICIKEWMTPSVRGHIYAANGDCDDDNDNDNEG